MRLYIYIYRKDDIYKKLKYNPVKCLQINIKTISDYVSCKLYSTY